MILKSYRPLHFRVEEFIPPNLYNQYGEQGLELLMDVRILWTMDNLREKFDVPITVNNYHSGGQFQQRGFRTDTAVGTLLSQHRYGRACDFDIKGVTSEQFRHMALTGELGEQLQYITRIENGVPWCHIDCAGVESDKIVFFNA